MSETLQLSDVARFLRRCGSSPERVFFHAVLRASLPEHQAPMEYFGEPVLKLCFADVAAYLTTQPRIGDRTRADFLFVADRTNLLVEIDDASHWGNKSRAQADRVRDRENLRDGVFTVRFTNDEVELDPDGCAAETIAALQALASHGEVGQGFDWHDLEAVANLWSPEDGLEVWDA